MYCPKCGALIVDEDDAFCLRCGASLDRMANAGAEAGDVVASAVSSGTNAGGIGAPAAAAYAGPVSAGHVGEAVGGVSGDSQAPDQASVQPAPQSSAKRGRSPLVAMFAAAVVVVIAALVALLLVPGSPLSVMSPGSTGPDAPEPLTAPKAFSNKLAALEEEYGSASIEECARDFASGYYELAGLCFAELVDFNGDGMDELLTVHRTDSDSYESDDETCEAYEVEVFEFDPEDDSGVKRIYNGPAMAHMQEAGASVRMSMYKGRPCLVYGGASVIGSSPIFAYKNGEIEQVAIYSWDAAGRMWKGSESPSSAAYREAREITSAEDLIWLLGMEESLKEMVATLEKTKSRLEGDVQNMQNEEPEPDDGAKRAYKELFKDKLAEVQNEHGDGRLVDGLADKKITGTGMKGLNHLEGMFYADLLDFEGDDVPELVVAYYDPDNTVIDGKVVRDSEKSSIDSKYRFEVWRYEDGGISKAAEFYPAVGGTPVEVAVVGKYGGKPAFGIDTGGSGVELRLMGVYADDVIEFASFTENARGDHRLNGRNVSSIEFQNGYNAASKDIDYIYVQELSQKELDDYSAKVKATLEALGSD